jgi:transposase
MTTRTRRKYDREFKIEAVKLVTERGTSIAEAARNLGIHENLLRTWKKKHLEDPEDSFPGKGYLKPQDEQLRRLKKKLADVEQERDILKKALAIFSKEPK